MPRSATLFAFLAFLVASCSDCSWFDPLPFRDLRRPGVLTEWHWDNLIDYDCDSVLEEECGPLFDPAEPLAEAPFSQEYVLAQADVLEIAVFGDDDTALEHVVIAPDGNLYYTFLGEIAAAGKTAEELGKIVEENLTDLYINPAVTITPQTSYDKNYKILGRLQRPGLFPVQDHMTLLDAIAAAGGFLHESYEEKSKSNELVFLADLSNSFILRRGKKLTVNFDELIFKGNKDYNIEIQAGDYIYIAANDALGVFVLGAIKDPQRISYVKGMRFTQAISIVTGWSSGLVNQTSGFGGGVALGSSGSGTAFAPDLTRFIVIRGDLHNPSVMTVDLTRILDGTARDLILQPGDIIFACNKTMRFGRGLVRLAIDTFVQSFSATAGAYYGQEWFPQGGQ